MRGMEEKEGIIEEERVRGMEENDYSGGIRKVERNGREGL